MKGHLRKRGKKSWAIILDLGRDENGKRKQKWHSFRGSKKEAEAKLARLVNNGYLQPRIARDAGRCGTKDRHCVKDGNSEQRQELKSAVHPEL